MRARHGPLLAAVEKRAEPYLKILLSVNDLVRVNNFERNP